MQYVAILCMVVAIAITPEWASAECKIEAWRAYNFASSVLALEGSTTCKEGQIRIRLYSGSGVSAKFLGTADGFIEGYIFKLFAQNLRKPPDMSIKYSIDP